MDIHTTYQQLCEAYSDENLNLIAGKLITLYKSKRYGAFREIANKISPYVALDEEKDVKLFPKLIGLYHPDRGEAIRKELEEAYSLQQEEGLDRFKHVLLVQNLERLEQHPIAEDIGYDPVYCWEETRKEGYYGYDEEEQEEYQWEEEELTFYNAMKLRIYGELTIDFPPYYLEDFAEYELTHSGIASLEGVAYCKHVVKLDLSFNQLTEIAELWGLGELEELYLSNNQIGYIDALSNLTKLRFLDLSGNEVDDLSPLYALDALEYVNVVNNPLRPAQIKELSAKGVVVVA
ncbi:leucine-rich repeat domain-containing protein [Pontibacter sp. MBLB2868]|uniref:leucine-rich repeat domain-containing protein n=1 Tax=Pontibacter sp. MBLB2868 TaxID=3451555 RepID=UPI003F750F7F